MDGKGAPWIMEWAYALDTLFHICCCLSYLTHLTCCKVHSTFASFARQAVDNSITQVYLLLHWHMQCNTRCTSV